MHYADAVGVKNVMKKYANFVICMVRSIGVQHLF